MPASQEVVIDGLVSRVLPGPSVDDPQSPKSVRLGRYREEYNLSLIPTTHLLADEGSYFVTENPTPGTSIAMAVSATLSETSSYFLAIQNTAPSGGVRIYPAYVKLTCEQAPASGTAMQLFAKTDVLSSYTSGGTALTPACPNSDVSPGSVAKINFGALTTVARTGAARTVYNGQPRQVIPVVGDTYLINFGCVEFAGPGVLNGSNPQFIPVGAAPVIIGPQSCLLIGAFFPSNSATPAKFEVEIGHWER